ncbi:MAG: hypothetical protein VZR24_13795 [Butyrivibrio hungatei]|nr:hypothetical protein [Butyrivibrio hungatei]
MNDTSFIRELKNGPEMKPEENVFQSIWAEYERVILHSLITSFGLDFIVRDQHGGDVDTIHNVREIGIDNQMDYKSSANKMNYENRGEYDTKAYHSHETFKQIKRDARTAFDEKGAKVADAYVEGNTLIPRNYNTIAREHQGQLDHVMSAHEIHNDRGRVLADMNGVELANNPDNLRFTNADLNLNKRDMTVEEYIQWCEANPDKVNQGGKKGEPLTEEVKEKMREEYNRSKKAYDAKIAQKYYTSPQFIKDTANAAAKRGAEMALRQALGFVFVEIWICAKEELQAVSAGSNLEEMLNAVGIGIQKGIESARKKYKDIIAKLEEGFTSGALASLTTTLCNIFFTTAKNIVRYIRQVYASAVQAGRVILFNPDNLYLGDRIKTSTVILATGASVLAGTAVGELLSKTPIGMIPELGQVVSTFCSGMVSGLLSCTLLMFIDRSKFINELVNKLNEIPSEVNNYKEIADAMEVLAAKIANLDTEKFKEDTAKFAKAADAISEIEDDDKLNDMLMNLYEQIGIKIPWEGDFNSFMGNRKNGLVFE